MNATEILDELPNLPAAELQRIHERIIELQEEQSFEETPEMLAAIDEGLRSLESESTYTPDEAHAKIAQWAPNSASINS